MAAAIVRRGRVLAAERAAPRDWSGYWELPGGKVEPGEADEQALTRECAEELGVRIQVGARIGPELALPQIGGVLRVHLARLVDGEPQALEHRQLRWLCAAEMGSVRWLPSDTAIVAAVREHLPTPDPAG